MSEQHFPPKGFVEPLSLSILKRVVCQAGGEWVGVQETIPPLPHLLLFNSPQTQSTLAVKLERDLTVAQVGRAIQKRLAESNKEFAKGRKK
jgi:hypothetical protein